MSNIIKKIFSENTVPLFLFFVVFVGIFVFWTIPLFEPLESPSGQTSVVDLSSVDLSGGTTGVLYEPDTAVVFDDNIRYNSDNFDLTYHDLNKYAGLYETNLRNIQVWDASSNGLVTLPYAPAQDFPVYYDIKKRAYGPFRPTYADSVLLSHYRN